MNTVQWITIIVGIAGAVWGVAATVWAAKRIAHRPRLKFNIETKAVIVPAELDIDSELFQIFVGERRIYNLCVLVVTVRLDGARDIVLPPHNPESPDRSLLMPFIQFKDFKILAVKTMNNDESSFYIPLARSGNDTRLHVNFQRMKAGTTARFQLLGTLFKQRNDFLAEQAQLFPGTIPDIDVCVSGLVVPDLLKSSGRPYLRNEADRQPPPSEPHAHQTPDDPPAAQ